MSRVSRDSEAEWIILSLGAMAAGFALGLLYTSPKGRKARVRMSEEASRGVKWLDHQLEEARARILAAGDEAADHLRTVVEETVEKVVPTFGSEDDWRSVYAETDEEVRRLKQ